MRSRSREATASMRFKYNSTYFSRKSRDFITLNILSLRANIKILLYFFPFFLYLYLIFHVTVPILGRLLNKHEISLWNFTRQHFYLVILLRFLSIDRARETCYLYAFNFYIFFSYIYFFWLFKQEYTTKTILKIKTRDSHVFMDVILRLRNFSGVYHR